MNEIVPSKKRGSGQRQVVRYSSELMAVICERISLGESLRAICANPEMPSEAAVRYSVSQDREGCKAGFEAAREVQAHRFAEELVALCDEKPPFWRTAGSIRAG